MRLENKKVSELLKKSRIEVSPEIFSLVSLKESDWHKLLEIPTLSPRMTVPFMIFKDRWEVTLLLDETDFETMRVGLREAKIERGFRLLCFDIEFGFSVVGFFSEISRILAEAEIPIFAISAFSRDHLLIKQEDLVKALKVLSEFVEELC
jgi:hypothetical protein